MNILLIGNAGGKDGVVGGGVIKVKLYWDLLLKEGKTVVFLELHKWKKRILFFFPQLISGFKKADVVVLMAGPRGSRIFLPFLVWLNKIFKKKIVFVPIGIGTLDGVVKRVPYQDVKSFLLCQDFHGLKDEKIRKALMKCSIVAVQNFVIKKCHEEFYGLRNCVVLPNFRVVYQVPDQYTPSEKDELHVVFLSRVHSQKGILDLMEAVHELDSGAIKNFYLDVYGPLELTNEEKNQFHSLCDPFIKYMGVVKQPDVTRTISHYDVFCFPSKDSGEGTPGALIESFFAGVPVLISSFAQASELVSNHEDGLIFELGSIDSLKESLVTLKNEKSRLAFMSKKALEESRKYTYEGNRELFLSIFSGDTERALSFENGGKNVL